jgi:hypothetical protein
MAIGTKTDFVIYNEQFWGGVIETLQQNADAFNAASSNALRLVTRGLKGEYERESFLKSTASLVSRRDPSSTGSVTDNKLAQGELIGVKVNRRLGPVSQSRDAFRKIGVSPDEFSMMLGAQAGVAIAVDYINIAIGAAKAAILNVGSSALKYDNTGNSPSTLSHPALVSGMALFGDRASRLECFVMHSKPYYDLVKQALSDKILNVADVVVYKGTTATLGKPTVILDSPSLINLVAGSPASTTYDVLALVENAVEVAESEERDIISQPVTGLENIVDRIQGEYAFNLRIKGMQWNTATGVNPTDTQIMTTTNWLFQASDNKMAPGVDIVTK